MKNLKRRITVFSLFLVLLTASGSAAITSLDITNTYPDSNLRNTGTVSVVRLEADSTTSTTVKFFLTKPDGTTIEVGSNDLDVKSGNPRETAFTIGDETIDQYGEYVVKANETANGLNQTLTYEIAPKPGIAISVPDLIFKQEEVEDVQIVVRTQSGNAIPDNEIKPGNASIYNIDDDPDTSKVEKNLTENVGLVYNKDTNNLEASIPVSELETGDFEVVGEFNITSCDSCEQYNSLSTSTFLIREGYDRLTYQNKWSSYNADDILSNQGELDNKVSENENKLDNNAQLIANLSIDDDKTLVWLWRGSVLLLIFIILGIVLYHSERNSSTY